MWVISDFNACGFALKTEMSYDIIFEFYKNISAYNRQKNKNG